LMKSVITVT